MRAELEEQTSSHSTSRLSFQPSSDALILQSEQLEERHISHLLDQGLYDQEARLLNRRGAELLDEGVSEKGRILLEKAQRVLESAASSGRVIDHGLVISVLHNLACYHQMTWNLNSCSNYLEALLFNLNSELQAINGASLAAQESSALTSELALYYLRFCAVNSQLKRHDAALIAAKKASSLLRISAQQLMRMAERSHFGLESRSMEILQELSLLKSEADGLQNEDLLLMAKKALYLWNRKAEEEQYGRLSHYSMGYVMQLRPRDEIQLDGPGEELEYSKLLERVLNEATCYLALATELRLLSARQELEVGQFKESQGFHLTAIAIMLRFLPAQIPFLKHALTSYTHHYRSPLEECPCLIARSDVLSPILDSTPAQKYAHLQAYVKASLATQQQFLKLDSYYYNESNRDKKARKSNSQRKDAVRRACQTSKQSVQKTPVGRSPSRQSPLRSRLSKKGQKQSVRGSIVKFASPNRKKITSILDEYFSPQCNRKKLLPKISKKKQNNDRIHKMVSQPFWRGNNLCNTGVSSGGKSSSRLQGLKSAGKRRQQLLLGKAKKKEGSAHYYY